MRKHVYIAVMPLPAASNKRGWGAYALATQPGIQTAVFTRRPG